MLKILQLGNPILEKKSEKVTDISDPNVQSLIDDMLELLDSIQEKSAGLSAPQVGVSKRIAICRKLENEADISKDPIWEIMINPEIVKVSGFYSDYWEGCLSIKEGDLFGIVSRPETVWVKYYDRNGKKRSIKATGYFSHIVQHEIDHLNGVLFISYISDPRKLLTEKELKALEKNK